MDQVLYTEYLSFLILHFWWYRDNYSLQTPNSWHDSNLRELKNTMVPFIVSIWLVQEKLRMVEEW